MMNYYEILGVEKDANKQAIKKAYYTRALACHPDKPGNTDDDTAIKQLTQAYSVLSDQDERKHYDNDAGAGMAIAASGASRNLVDRVQDFFGFGNGGR